jgi:hypothetical protein
MITALFMGWTDPVSKQWFPIRKMSLTAAGYHTCYVNGVFQAIDVSPNLRLLFEKGLIKPDEVKISQDIPAIFAQRMPIARPEDAQEELEFFGLPKYPVNPIAYASRSGGYSNTDGYDLFPEVTADGDGDYHFYFLPQHLVKLQASTHEYIDRLSVGTVLDVDPAGYIAYENTILGKLPGYLADAIGHDRSIEIEVAKVNSQTSWRYYHLLCHATVKFKPFTESHYQALQSVLAT